MRHVGRLALSAICLTLIACAGEHADFYDTSFSPECSAKVIDGEYLVKLKSGGSVQRLKLDRAQLKELLRDRNVDWVEPNYRVTIPHAVPPFMHRELDHPHNVIIGANYAWNRGFRGQGILVGVVDSGIDGRHPLLQGKVKDGFNFIADNELVRDETGHGTHIAGIIAGSQSSNFTGVAPGARLIAADFMNEDRGDEFNAIRAIEFSIARGARIINNSWSNMCSNAIRSAFTGWESLDIIFVNASGNDALQIDHLSIFPANLILTNGVTVGSVDNLGRRSLFSNFGRNVVIYAPGEDIYSLATTDFGRGFLVPRSGTSMATAFVSGALALTWSARPELPATRIVQQIRKATSAENAEDESPIINVQRLLEELN